MKTIIGIAVLFAVSAFANVAPSVTVATPEIDPSSATAAFALLSGGMMLLRSRRAKR